MCEEQNAAERVSYGIETDYVQSTTPYHKARQPARRLNALNAASRLEWKGGREPETCRVTKAPFQIDDQDGQD